MPTSGPYLASYLPHAGASGNVSQRGNLGVFREGWLLRWEVFDHLVNDTTSYAKTLIETIYIGADWTLSARAVEYSVGGLVNLAWPWNPPAEAFDEDFMVQLVGVGSRGTNVGSGELSLAVISGTPAASQGPASLTASQALGGSSMFSFDSRNRDVPVTMRLLPSTASSGEGGKTTWFVTS